MLRALVDREVSRRDVVVLAALLFVAATAIRFVSGDPANGLSFLYLVPICLVANEFGGRAGIAVGLVAIALVALWAAVEHVHLTTLSYASRLVTFAGVGAFVGVLATQRRRAFAESERWFEMSNGLLCVADREGRFTRVNDAWSETLGYSKGELLSQPFVAFVHPDDRERTIAAAQMLAGGPNELFDFENRYRAKDGRWHWLYWSARSDDRQIYAVARDVTDRKRLEAQRLDSVRALAHTDELTGLPNRRAFESELPRELARARRSGLPLCVIMLDLDGLKQINDAHGHAAGSNAIKRVAAASAASLRSTDMIARWGGDEFGVVLPGSRLDEAGAVAERLRRALRPRPTISVGIAQWDGQESVDELVERADGALYRAKRAGRDRVVADARPGQARLSET